jgi:hypothetical protein
VRAICALAVAPLMPGTVCLTTVDGGRQLDADGFFFVELDADDRLGNQIVLRVAQRLRRDLDLLVVRRVHEVEMVAVVVHVLHFALVERRPLDILFRAELLVHQRQRPDVPHPHLDVRALVARRQVMVRSLRPLPTGGHAG